MARNRWGVPFLRSEKGERGAVLARNRWGERTATIKSRGGIMVLRREIKVFYVYMKSIYEKVNFPEVKI